MSKTNQYTLPNLSFPYNALEPFISEAQLQIHHQKHHQKYIENANKGLEKLQNARQTDAAQDIKAILKDLSFNIGGHILHTLFWGNLAPSSKALKEPEGEIVQIINKEFGNFARFKQEFSQAANTAEGSAWAALVYDQELQKPIISQIEKHNINLYPNLPILLVLDIWEHAYYLDYQNDRAKFIEGFWNIIDWTSVNQRYLDLNKL